MDTVWWDTETGSVCLIDQTALPGRREIVQCLTVERLKKAIATLEIRGAPALGVAGAYGVALAALTSKQTHIEDWKRDVRDAAEDLRRTRPTAVNLSWGIDRVLNRIADATSVDEATQIALQEARTIAEEDEQLCRRIGSHGARLFPDTCTVLTHCNAGALACKGWGTALGVIRSARDLGKQVKVIACETRPLLQGSRLTAWELAEEGIDVTVIVDSAAAFLMRRGEIDLVIVGADRITRDAVFNKIGTYMHAVSAHYHQIPFYVAAPLSTYDPRQSEKDVVIEQRSREEVACLGGKVVVPERVKVRNYAFDATPLELVSALITEKGVHLPPLDTERISTGERT